ncbi:helix-turn-helix domain-containing protein [Microbulbifer sp. 2201CG32-9]|uniref:helix-turn-helix domain-containing protein n=1 Tax=Microbulbifer sp. 2201CG32-9 TaxID=3232309 RepID=UPI00345C5B96
MFNPSRLTIARKRRRLTGRELAGFAGITPKHLSGIEKGKVENVGDATITALAKALSYPVAFFAGNDIDMPTKDTAAFRSLSAMSAKEREAALSAGSLAHLLADWASERFNLPELDLIDIDARHGMSPEASAKALRSYWGLGERPVSNVVKLLESKGIRIFSLAEDTKNVDAFSCWRNGVPYIFLNTFKTAERSRFDAMHELGHLVLHRHGKPQGRQAESEADSFASYFLMPSMDLVANIPFVTSLKQLVQAKKRWGVSVAALAYRLHKAGKLSDWQYRNFCMRINKQFGQSEPDGLPRERSIVWEKIFRELWKERTTREQVAKELCLPLEEVDGLVFNLSEANPSTGTRSVGAPQLRLA